MSEAAPSDEHDDDLHTDFTRPNIDVVTEDNWEELSAQGVTVLDPSVPTEKLHVYLPFCEDTWGTPNVITGDSFDYEAERPLRHKPGRGIYVRLAGLAYNERRKRAQAEQEARWHEPTGASDT